LLGTKDRVYLMPILTIVVLELISIIVVVSSASSLGSFKTWGYALPVFAQEELPPPDSTPVDSAPVEPTPSDSAPMEPTTAPSDSANPTPAQNLNPDLMQPALQASPTAQTSAVPIPPSNSQSVVLDQSQQETQISAQTILTSGDIVSGPAENVNEKVQEKAASQDQKLENVKTPEEKTTLSIDFAKDSVKEIEQQIKNNDFSTTVFVVQRLSNQIDTALQNSQVSSNSKSIQSLTKFCNQAEVSLRTQLLTVPGEAEQDFEIARAKCLNITQ